VYTFSDQLLNNTIHTYILVSLISKLPRMNYALSLS